MLANSSSTKHPMAWRVARIVLALAFFGFFVWTMTYRFHNAPSPWSVHGDQHQSIGQFWRYAIDGAMPKGHLLSDYAFAYHSPPFWLPIMAIGSAIAGPLTASKVLGVFAYLVYGLTAVLIVGRRTDWALGWLAGITVIRNPPDTVEQITGGMARSLAPALLYLFLWAFASRRHKWVLVILVLQAGIYPAIAIPCCICYSIYVLWKGPWPDRIRRCLGMFVAGVLVICLGEFQQVTMPKWWGDVVTFAEADKMPAWHAGGRFPEIPHRTLFNLMHENLVRGYKDLGHHLAGLPSALQNFWHRSPITAFVILPIVIALVLALAGFLLKWSRPPPAGPARKELPREFPWDFVWILLASIVGWFIVKAFAFKLFLPSRQIGFTVQYIIITALPILVWWGAAGLLRFQRAAALAVTVVVTVVPAFVFRGDGLGTNAGGYSNHAAEAKLWMAIRKLPIADEVACDTRYCEVMMPLGQHTAYAARNLAHPFRKGYYEEVERRLVEQHRVLYATTAQEVTGFYDKEHVRWFVYDDNEMDKPDQRLYRPARDKSDKIWRAGRGKPRLLENPPKEAVRFRDGHRILLDLSKFPRDYTAPAELQPGFIGPPDDPHKAAPAPPPPSPSSPPPDASGHAERRVSPLGDLRASPLDRLRSRRLLLNRSGAAADPDEGQDKAPPPPPPEEPKHEP